ncbi:hypothetical protein MMPV_000527 [Pyropia vietnamensis]
MGHSSWRKAAPRREHKERSQPAARARKWALLEKHKDYKLRARDYHSKQARLAVLRNKAATRNPDEFYHRMARTVTDGGAGHRRREGAPMGPYAEALPLAQRSAEEQMLGDTADARYVGVKAAVEAAKVRRLAASLHFAGDVGAAGAVDTARAGKLAAKGRHQESPLRQRRAAVAATAAAEAAAAAPAARHVLFVEDAAEVAAFDAATHFDTPAETLARPANRVRFGDVAAGRVVLSGGGLAEGAAAARDATAAYKELAARARRVAKLDAVREDVELIKRLRGKGAKYQVRKRNPDTGAPAVYKWRQVRAK